MGAILISLTEIVNNQGVEIEPLTKLIGLPFLTKVREINTRTILTIDGRRVNEEREVSETYDQVKVLSELGYSDFLLPITVLNVDGGIRDNYPYETSILASKIIEIYSEDSTNPSSNSIIRFRDDETSIDVFYTVSEDLSQIQSLIPVIGGGDNIYTTDGSIPATTTRTVGVPSDSKIEFLETAKNLLTIDGTGGGQLTSDVGIIFDLVGANTQSILTGGLFQIDSAFAGADTTLALSSLISTAFLKYIDNNTGFARTLDLSGNFTGSSVIQMPDASGTLALTNQLTGNGIYDGNGTVPSFF
jgi:hypothetical protein